MFNLSVETILTENKMSHRNTTTPAEKEKTEPNKTKPRVIELALMLADSAARSDIEIYCDAVECNPSQNMSEIKRIRSCWYSVTNTHPNDPEIASTVAIACEYLSLRGKLLRHSEQPHLVRPV